MSTEMEVGIAAVVAILIIFVQVLIGQVKLARRVAFVQRALQEDIPMAFEELKAAIEHSTSVQTAAVALIKNIADKLATMRPDQDEIRKMAAELRQRADELAGAIALHEEDDDEEDDDEENAEADRPPTRRR